MSCLCKFCIADYLESLVKKVREEVKAKKQKATEDAWRRESEGSGICICGGSTRSEEPGDRHSVESCRDRWTRESEATGC